MCSSLTSLVRDELFASFHDAEITDIAIDYASGQAVFGCELCVGNWAADNAGERERSRHGKLIFSGLLYCVIDAPDPGEAFLPEDTARPGTITADGDVDALPKTQSSRLPEVPNGSFVHWFFVSEWNAFIYIAARDVTFAWSEND